MGDILVADGYSRAAAYSAALASGFELADRLQPYVRPAVDTLKCAWRDYSKVKYGPGSGKRGRRAEKRIKKVVREELKDPVINSTKNMTGSSIQFTRSYDRIGRKRKRTAKQIFDASIGGMYESIFRWQRVSPSLLGPGETDVSYGITAAPGANRVLPFHFMSLTNNIHYPEESSYGAYKNGMHRLTYNPTNQHFGYQRLVGQDNTGAFVSTEFQQETGVARNPNGFMSTRPFHKWTDIRLNLYGSAYYPLKYEILVVTGMDLEMSIFDYTAGGQPIILQSNLNAWLRDHVKDYIGNPIVGSNIDRTDLRGKVRVIRRRIVNIEPLSYTDAWNQTSPNIGPLGIDASNVKNINMFIRHDRFRDYAWRPKSSDMSLQTNLNGTGFDKEDTQIRADLSAQSDVDREERVYLIIKCTAPAVLTADAYEAEDAVAPTALLDSNVIPKFVGSYDCVVRNCFRYNDNP